MADLGTVFIIMIYILSVLFVSIGEGDAGLAAILLVILHAFISFQICHTSARS